MCLDLLHVSVCNAQYALRSTAHYALRCARSLAFLRSFVLAGSEWTRSHSLVGGIMKDVVLGRTCIGVNRNIAADVSAIL